METERDMAAADGEWRLITSKVLPARSAALNDKLFLADEAVRGFLVTLDFLGQFLGIVFKIHLRYDFVLSTAHLEVEMCRPHPVGSSRIGCRFNCLESIPAF